MLSFIFQSKSCGILVVCSTSGPACCVALFCINLHVYQRAHVFQILQMTWEVSNSHCVGLWEEGKSLRAGRAVEVESEKREQAYWFNNLNKNNTREKIIPGRNLYKVKTSWKTLCVSDASSVRIKSSRLKC